jgi:hypothetical protein
VEIEYVTHASLLLRSSGGSSATNLLLDPFFYPELDPILAPSVRNFPPRDLDPEGFGQLRFVFSSHEHHDHCHPETLARLADRITTVVLPADRPVLEARYRDLGFRDLVFLENRTPRALGAGLTVTSYWDDPIDSALVVEMDGKVVLHANDCKLEPATLADIARRTPVDYAFLCSTSTQELFPLILPRPPAELFALAAEREEAFFESELARIDALRPRVVLPYSYTASYVEAGQLHLNGYGRITPPLYRERLRARLPDVDCWVLQPGDVIDTQAHAIRPIREANLWGRDLPEFRANLAAYSRDLQDRLPRFDAGDAAVCDAPLRRHLEARLARGIPEKRIFDLLDGAVAIVVEGTAGSRRLVVDVGAGTLSSREAGLSIHMPAALMQSMLAGAYDPFMILYTYRVTFAPGRALARLALTPDKEYLLYMAVVLSLFMDDANPMMAQLAGVGDALCG